MFRRSRRSQLLGGRTPIDKEWCRGLQHQKPCASLLRPWPPESQKEETKAFRGWYEHSLPSNVPHQLNCASRLQMHSRLVPSLTWQSCGRLSTFSQFGGWGQVSSLMSLIFVLNYDIQKPVHTDHYYHRVFCSFASRFQDSCWPFWVYRCKAGTSPAHSCDCRVHFTICRTSLAASVGYGKQAVKNNELWYFDTLYHYLLWYDVTDRLRILLWYI